MDGVIIKMCFPIEGCDEVNEYMGSDTRNYNTVVGSCLNEFGDNEVRFDEYFRGFILGISSELFFDTIEEDVCYGTNTDVKIIGKYIDDIYLDLKARDFSLWTW